MNSLYDRARERFATKQLDWLGLTWRAWLIDSSYTFDAAHTDFVADVPADSKVKAALNYLEPTSVTQGICNCAPFTFGPVPAWPRLVTALIITDASDDSLLWYGDTGFGLPFAPNGSEVVGIPDQVFGGFFQL